MITKQKLRDLLVKGKFNWSVHALEMAEERIVTEADIKFCARKAKMELQLGRDTWKVKGKDEHGESLTVICDYLDRVLIITIY